jgi:transketolase
MSNFINQGNKATRIGFGEGVAEAGSIFQNLVVLGADITGSVGLNIFAERFPERFFSFGIAEQNIAAVAAGMALTNKIPVFSTYAVFAAFRAADQIRISICYNNVKVIIGGAHAGISVGPDGATHQALEDIAVIRSLPNITLISPADANQAKAATIAAIKESDGPVYIRFGREPVPNFTSINQDFKIGKGEILTDGTDVAIVATGHMVWEALMASKELEKKGIDAAVVNIHTIKPIDKELLISIAKKTGLVVTVEEHQIHGGLGSAVAEVLCQEYPIPMKIIGMPDCFGESGKPEELLQKYGLNAEAIAKSVFQFVKEQK